MLLLGDGESTIKKVRDAINGIKPFRVDFTVTVETEEGIDFEESGTILFQHPKMVKWEYLHPDYKVFLLRDKRYQFYDKENRQLTVGELSEENQQWIWSVLLTPVTSQYIFTHLENSRRLHIKNLEESFEMDITLNEKFLPETAVQNDPSGVMLKYHFKNYRKKVKISKEAFSIEIPKDIEIIEMN